MSRWLYVVVVILAGCAGGAQEKRDDSPHEFRLHGWITATATITQDGELIYDNEPVSFASYNGIGSAHSYWGALCNAAEDRLVCKYQFTDQTYGPEYAVEVELDGWADESGAEFYIWQRFDGSEITRHYTITHTQLSPF